MKCRLTPATLFILALLSAMNSNHGAEPTFSKDTTQSPTSASSTQSKTGHASRLAGQYINRGSNLELAKLLYKPITVDFKEQPLDIALEQISEAADVPIILDEQIGRAHV